MIYIHFVCVLTIVNAVFSVSPGAEIKTNDRPIIGVLAQEVYNPQPGRNSYIAASYVKFLESAGARVVPVTINKSDEENTRLFKSINGVLFPGGGVSIETSGYSRAAALFYRLALEANSKGDYFPILGICLGFQQLTLLTSGQLLLSHTNTSGVALPLNFTDEIGHSRLFKDFPGDLMQSLASESLTENSHQWSLTTARMNFPSMAPSGTRRRTLLSLHGPLFPTHLQPLKPPPTPLSFLSMKQGKIFILLAAQRKNRLR